MLLFSIVFAVSKAFMTILEIAWDYSRTLTCFCSDVNHVIINLDAQIP